MIDELVASLSERATTVLALEGTRRLVPLLYASEEYVDAKLIEVPCEEALQFYISEAKVFGRIYGHVDALIWRLQERSGRSRVDKALEAALNATLSACIDVHAYHVEVDGGNGPSYDCYLAESSPDDARHALRCAWDSERELVARLQGYGGAAIAPFTEWLPAAVDGMSKEGVSLGAWISSQPRLSIPYPFRRER